MGHPAIATPTSGELRTDLPLGLQAVLNFFMNNSQFLQRASNLLPLCESVIVR